MAPGLIRRHFLALAMAGLAAACAATPSLPPPPVTQIFLVRHVEKAVGDDPALTAAGQRRAAALAERLAPEGVTAIWSTETRRTQETARSLADAMGLAVQPYDPSDLARLAARLKRVPGTVLIVGHSNTTDKLAGLLGADPGPPIDEAEEYDRLYVISVDGGGAVRSRIDRYGAHSRLEAESP